MGELKVAVGTDGPSALAELVVAHLVEAGHEPQLFGHLTDQEPRWPDVARDVAERVASGDVDEGILMCWTGTGVSIAANKVPGIRAALCSDSETAKGARLWNNANVLCLSNRQTSLPIASEILSAWFATSYEANEVDDGCLNQLSELEATYRSDKRGK